jgi:hypothetical protein
MGLGERHKWQTAGHPPRSSPAASNDRAWSYIRISRRGGGRSMEFFMNGSLMTTSCCARASGSPDSQVGRAGAQRVSVLTARLQQGGIAIRHQEQDRPQRIDVGDVVQVVVTNDMLYLPAGRHSFPKTVLFKLETHARPNSISRKAEAPAAEGRMTGSGTWPEALPQERRG